MSTPAEVDALLHGLGWSDLEGAEPFAVEKALETMTPWQIASALEAWCQRFAGGYGYLQARWDAFNIDVKYWRMNTLVALGLTVEEIPEHIEPARSVGEWFRNMTLGYGRTGFKDGGACSREEYAQRLIVADRIPPEWKGKEIQYRALVLSGGIPINLHGFEVAYYQSASVDDVPFDQNKWFENVSTPSGGHRPWKADGTRNPK